MPNLIRIVGRLPLPKATRLRWQEFLVSRAYNREIAKARTRKDANAVRHLELQHQEELAIMQEESDLEYTTQLLKKARKLRVPIPTFRVEEGEIKGPWDQGTRTGMIYLSDAGVSQIREAIRTEQRWRHEQRTQWAVWLSALTGVIGALTGLLAVLGDRLPWR